MGFPKDVFITGGCLNRVFLYTERSTEFGNVPPPYKNPLAIKRFGVAKGVFITRGRSTAEEFSLFILEPPDQHESHS